MHSQVIATYALQQHQHRHVAQRLSRSAAREDKIIISYDLRRNEFNR